MTGRLRALSRILATYADDCGYQGTTDAERECACVLSALEMAILTGATAELARLVKPWMDPKLVAYQDELPLDEQAREDAIASSAREVGT